MANPVRSRRYIQIIGVSATALLLAACASSANRAGDSSAPPLSTSSSSEPPTTSTSESSVAPTAPTSTSPSTAAEGSAADWDVDGDGHPDTANAVNLSGNDWRLTVDMTSLGKQSVDFSGSPMDVVGPAPTIVGSVDADRDNHAEIFVKVDAGASTQFWSIFKLVGGQVVQDTVDGHPVRLALGGTVTHQGGIRCNGVQFVTVGESVAQDGSTWSYESDTYTWVGSTLVLQSKHTGQTTSSGPPAEYSGVSCGDLVG
jgi:hypothetical protein